VLRVVEVNAPAVNCLFDPACRVAATDSTGSIPIPASGTSVLQSRTFRGRPGSPADGLHLYQYRVDLRRAAGVTRVPCLNSLRVEFGPAVRTLDLDGDGEDGDEVFVITRGGAGSVGIASAERAGQAITFQFSAPVCAGARPGSGQSTFFLGLVSADAPGNTTASVIETNGKTYTAKARGPVHKVPIPQGIKGDAQLGRHQTLQNRAAAAGGDDAVIDRLAPKPCVDRGGQVTVEGLRFGRQQDSRLLELGGHGIGVGLRVASWSDTRITAIVPDDPRIEYGQWYYIGLQNRDRQWISNISRTITICRRLQ
jgi:hypothetical protein